MQIIYRIGDVIDADEPILLHGCNAQGVFGAGVALAIRNRLYYAYAAYRAVYLRSGLRLGDVVWAINVRQGQRPRLIGNAITQEYYGSEPRQYVSYEALRTALRHVDELLTIAPTQMMIAALPTLDAVAMPLIGAGRGGGDWNHIAAIIEEESQHFQPVVYRPN